MKMKPPSGPKKQTQNKPNSKPVLSAVEWANFQDAKMNLELIRKSGHTNLLDVLIFLEEPGARNC
jgi:uncharacterized protein (DUF2237 family)